MNTLLASTGEICKSALWDRIYGWEVVFAVLLIVTAWCIVQVSRMYFMWKVAATNAKNFNGDEKEMK